MKIFWAGIQLSDWADYPAQNVSVNGEEAYEAVDVLNSAAKKFFDRGNQSISLRFTVRREFATNRECQIFLLTHFSKLPKTGNALIQCGVPGEGTGEVSINEAILSASPLGIFNGVEAIVQYVIVGPSSYGSAVVTPPPGGGGGGSGEEDDMTDFVDLARTGAGNDDIPGTPRIVAVKLVIGAGTTDYTRTITLLAAIDKGAERDIYLELPGNPLSTPTIQIRDLTSGGTERHRLVGNADELRAQNVRFRWDGANWRKFHQSEL